MSIEAAIAELTAAVKENTAAHTKLAEVAAAAAGGKAAAPAKEETKDEAPAEEKKAPAKKAPAKKPAAKKPATKQAEPPELEGSVSAADLKKAAAAFLDGDDEEARDANKQKFIAALNHLGAAKLGEVDSDEDRARLAGYIAYWNEGLEVDFEAVDEIVSAAGGEDEDEGEDDDILG